MPIIKSAVKRMRQTIKRRARNMTQKRNMRTAAKAFSADKTAETLAKAHAELDKAVKKNIMHKNTAARKKAQLAKAAKEGGVKIAAKAAKPAAKPVATKAAPKTASKTATAKKAPAKKSAAKTSKKED